MRIPGGTKIGWNSWSLLRSKDVFGHDAEVFRPERWLEASPEKRAAMERHVDLVFGDGRYMCAGRTIAMMELNKIFFEVITGVSFRLSALSAYGCADNSASCCGISASKSSTQRCPG